MTSSLKKIIVTLDAQDSAAATMETTLNFAKTNDAEVLVIDTIHPPSRSSLLFSANADDVYKLVSQDKRKRIESAVQRFRDLGVSADGKLLEGKSSEAITRESISQKADLVIRYMKGTQSRYPGLFGNTARNLMRICPSPLLFVGEQPLENPHVLACINSEHDAAENTAIVANAQLLANDRSRLSALVCWDLPGKKYMRHYLSDELLEQTLAESESVHRQLFDKLRLDPNMDCFGERFHLEYGEPAKRIPEFCKENAIDVVVMSSASQTHPLKRLLGSTIESVLDQLPCALLVVKQEGFDCPITASPA